jgi:hypothetical protein
VIDVTNRQSFENLRRILRLNHFELNNPDRSQRYSRKIHVVGDLSKTTSNPGASQGGVMSRAIERTVSFEEASMAARDVEINYSEVNIATGFNVRQWGDQLVDRQLQDIVKMKDAQASQLQTIRGCLGFMPRFVTLLMIPLVSLFATTILQAFYILMADKIFKATTFKDTLIPFLLAAACLAIFAFLISISIFFLNKLLKKYPKQSNKILDPNYAMQRNLIFISFVIIGFVALGMGVASIVYLSKTVLIKRDWIMMGVELSLFVITTLSIAFK